MKRRIVGILLCVAMLFTMLPAMSTAATSRVEQMVASTVAYARGYGLTTLTYDVLGDVTGDGTVNIQDVMLLYNVISGNIGSVI